MGEVEKGIDERQEVTGSNIGGPILAQKQTLTFGEKAVGLNFNPGGDPEVTNCKQLFAQAIDQLNDLRGKAGSEGDSEKARRCAIAITQIEIAQMCAVKAITWRS